MVGHHQPELPPTGFPDDLLPGALAIGVLKRPQEFGEFVVATPGHRQDKFQGLAVIEANGAQRLKMIQAE